MRREEILRSIYDFANRADPYPLFAELRKEPVSWQEDGPNEAGTYVVSAYRELVALLHDPRISSDFRKGDKSGGPRTSMDRYSFIRLDPPEHDRLRRLAMRHFGPPDRPEYVTALRPEIQRITATLVDALRDERRIDVVARLAYALPVAVICTILGVPREDQPQFQAWTDAVVNTLGAHTPEARAEGEEASRALSEDMAALVRLRREEPKDDLLSRTSTTIPKGVLVTLALAAGNRDPARFPDPDRFDPERRDNAHLGFGSGIHYCFGAPLARVEAQIALLELARRLDRPRLVVDPPPYRVSPILRGPRELLIEIDGVRSADGR